MQQTLSDGIKPFRAPALAMLCAMAVAGCVSTETHNKTLAELDASKKTSAQLQQQLTGLQKNLDQESTHAGCINIYTASCQVRAFFARGYCKAF